MMRRRKALAEHPFGTLKCRAGYRHFLVRGFDKVRGEWSLMALCYNFSRVLRIIGLDRWRVRLAQRAAKPLHRLVAALLRAYCRVSRDAVAFFAVSRAPVRGAPRPPSAMLLNNMSRCGLSCPASSRTHPTSLRAFRSRQSIALGPRPPPRCRLRTTSSQKSGR
jgi:hypothetical protein